MKKENNRTQNAVVGAAGEHLILSNLLRLNFIAGKAPDNTKDYDLIVLNKDGTSSSPIQVKTSLNKNSGWVLQQKHEKPIKNLFFCFVSIYSNSNKSEIYVIDSETVADIVKTGHSIWLKLPGMKDQKHKDTIIRHMPKGRIFPGLKKKKDYEKYLTASDLKFLNKYLDGWIDKYKDAWHLIEK